MSFIIFDTEYTTWKGCQENGWHGKQKKEIVQISALKISDKLEVLKEFNQLCKPSINPILSDYFVQLTHITNEQVQKNGIPFPDVFKNFKKFVGHDICLSHAWGKNKLYYADGNIVQENLKLNHLPINKSIQYKNIAPIFKKLYKKHHIKIEKQASGEIIQLLNIKSTHQNLNPHNALFDVYSILLGLRYFKSDSIIQNFIKSLKDTKLVCARDNINRKPTN